MTQETKLAVGIMAAVRLLGDIEAKDNGNAGLTENQRKDLYKQISEAAQIARQIILLSKD